MLVEWTDCDSKGNEPHLLGDLARNKCKGGIVIVLGLMAVRVMCEGSTVDCIML